MNLSAAQSRFRELVIEPLRDFYSPFTMENAIEPMRVIEVHDDEIVIACPFHAPLFAETFGEDIKTLLNGGSIRIIDEYQSELVPGNREHQVRVTFTDEKIDA